MNTCLGIYYFMTTFILCGIQTSPSTNKQKGKIFWTTCVFPGFIAKLLVVYIMSVLKFRRIEKYIHYGNVDLCVPPSAVS